MARIKGRRRRTRQGISGGKRMVMVPTMKWRTARVGKHISVAQPHRRRKRNKRVRRR